MYRSRYSLQCWQRNTEACSLPPLGCQAGPLHILASVGCSLWGWGLPSPHRISLRSLEVHHALFENLNLALASPPVLTFGHALLHSIMELGAPGAGYHAINGVIFILVFLTTAVMRWGGGHLVIDAQRWRCGLAVDNTCNSNDSKLIQNITQGFTCYTKQTNQQRISESLDRTLSRLTACIEKLFYGLRIYTKHHYLLLHIHMNTYILYLLLRRR